MGRCRFVQPETITLQLSEGDWIEVKKRLNNGERRYAMAAIIGTYTDDGVKPDKELLGMAENAAYLVDWSFTDAQGKRVPIDTDGKKFAALKALDPDDYDEIDAAIERHKKAMDVERAALKNAPDGKRESSAILSSAV